MTICITSYGPTLDSKMQSIFGRCSYFVFVDPETDEAEFLINNHAADSAEAGVKSAELVAGKGAAKVLTGKIGDKAKAILDRAGIDVVSVPADTVREAINRYRRRP